MKKTFLLLLLCVSLVNSSYGKLYVSTEDIKVRKSKGAHVGSLGVIKKGTIVDVSNNDGKWGVVEYGKKEGYIKTKYLRDAAAPPAAAVQEPQEQTADSSGLIWIVLFAGSILAAAYLIRRFADAGKTGLATNNLRGAFAKHHHHITTYWYQCKHCSAIVKKHDQPSHNGCIRSTMHHWTQMAEVGSSKFSCKQCMATIQSTDMPNMDGCPGGGYHAWIQR